MATTGVNKALAAGLIVYRLTGAAAAAPRQIEYLMMQTSYGIHHWTPPKGHLDPGESDLEAAVRETHEEAGLERGRDYELVDEASFRLEANYEAFGKPKRVLYWLATLRADARDVRLSNEHQAFKWTPLAEAIALSAFEPFTACINKADAKIRQIHGL